MLEFTAYGYSPGFQWPTRRHDGEWSQIDGVINGTVIRLRSDYPLETLPPEQRVIARTLQKRGAMLTDKSYQHFSIRIPYDPNFPRNWSSSLAGKLDLRNDFEVVDISVYREDADPNNIRVTTAAPGADRFMMIHLSTFVSSDYFVERDAVGQDREVQIDYLATPSTITPLPSTARILIPPLVIQMPTFRLD